MKSWVLCEPRQILSLWDRRSSFNLVLVAGCAKFRSPYQNLEIADYGDFCVLGWCAPRSTSREQGDKSLVGFPVSEAIYCVVMAATVAKRNRASQPSCLQAGELTPLGVHGDFPRGNEATDIFEGMTFQLFSIHMYSFLK